jgi:hypothetical protein
MRTVWNVLLFTFFVMCLFLFRPRQDVVFAAVNKTQYIRLFEKGMDFEICIKDNHTFTGTYTIMKDTVYLSYREQPFLASFNSGIGQTDFRRILPRKLYINSKASNIEARDGKKFSAKIFMDARQKEPNTPTYSIRILKNQDTQLSGI